MLSAAHVDIRKNITQANRYAILGAVAGPVGSLAVYGYLVNTGGPQDVKNQPGPGYGASNPVGIAAGNISYGVTCPFGATVCQAAAGIAQGVAGLANSLSGGRFGHGSPGPASTFFDSPADNAQIQTGQAMRAAGCHQ